MRAAPLFVVALVGCTAPPDAPIVAIAPELPTTFDALTATATLPDDVDADLTFTWFKDDVLQSALVGPAVEAERTRRSERWTVEVVATNTAGESPPGVASVVIQNAAPTLTVTLAPDPPTSAEDLVATAQAVDPDGDPTSLVWAWTVDGVDAGIASASVPADRTAAGQMWAVSVTASDGIVSSEPATASVTVAAADPVIRNLTFTPDPPVAALPTQLSFEALDPDGGEVTTTITWTVQGNPVAGADGTTLPAGSARRDQIVTATVRAEDAQGGVTEAELTRTAGNSVPTVDGGVEVLPEQVDVTTPITCNALDVTDADGDVATVAWEWRLNGVATTVRGATFFPSAQGAVRGDRIQCLAIASDSAGPGPATPGETRILGNARPTLASAAIVRPADESEPLSAVLGAATDPDTGDTVSFAYRWYAGTTTLGTDPTLPQDTYQRGMTVRLTVTPRDPLGLEGAPVEATGSFTAENRPPFVVSHSENALPVTRAQPLAVTPDTRDPDGDPVTLTWTWKQGGLTVPEVTGPVFPVERMVRNAVLLAELVPRDNQGINNIGPTYLAGPWTIANARPVILRGTFEVDGVLSALPEVDETTTLRCVVTSADVSDADADVTTVRYEWWVNDFLVRTAPLIDGTDFDRGDEVLCRAIANDTIDDSAAFVVGPVTVQNARPRADGIDLSPASPRTEDTIVATLVNPRDPDGTTPPDVSWAWRVGGVLTDVTAAQLPSTAFVKGDRIDVTATLVDDEGAIGTVTRNVTIGNTAPTIVSAQLVPTTPRTNTDVTLELDLLDPDTADTLTPTVTWFVSDGQVFGVSGTTLPSDRFIKGNTIRATVIVRDGTTQTSPRAVGPITVGDALPGDFLVQVTPRISAPASRDLRCDVALRAEDPDGEAVVYAMRWERNDVAYVGGGGSPAPTTTRNPGDTIPAAATRAGDRWRCIATARSASDPTATTGTEATSTARVVTLDYRDLGLGGNFACGVDRQGATRCWGLNTHGEATPALGSYKQVFVGDTSSCGLTSTDTLTCWGATPATAPSTTFRDVSIGAGHACGAQPSGSVACWGSNTEGQRTVPAGASGRQVAVGGLFSCVLGSSGTPVCWGDDTFDQTEVPTDVRFLDISAGTDWACGVTTEGAIRCWGGREPGDIIQPAVADAPGGSDWVDVEAGPLHVCAIDSSDRITCWGDDSIADIDAPEGTYALVAPGQRSTCAVALTGGVVCWGDDRRGQTVPSTDPLAWLAPGPDHSCAVDDGGDVLCWGTNARGQASPPPLLGPIAETIVGTEYSCALQDDNRAACWGRTTFGIQSTPFSQLDTLDAGVDHACALTVTGGVACWGGSDPVAGQGPEVTGAPIAGTFVDIAAGDDASCAINSAGQIQCWGAPSSPVIANAPASGTFTAVDIDQAYGCAIRESDGALTCWCQPPASGPFPCANTAANTVVSNANTVGAGVRDLAVGRLHACVINANQEVRCFGDALDRRLVAPGGQFSALLGGREHMCGIRLNGAVECWGPEARR